MSIDPSIDIHSNISTLMLHNALWTVEQSANVAWASLEPYLLTQTTVYAVHTFSTSKYAQHFSLNYKLEFALHVM